MITVSKTMLSDGKMVVTAYQSEPISGNGYQVMVVSNDWNHCFDSDLRKSGPAAKDLHNEMVRKWSVEAQ